MAVRYNTLDQADDGSHVESPSPGPFPPDSASPLSPMSEATATTMASPASPSSPLPYVTLAEQTFTPLSVDTSGFYAPDPNAEGKKSPLEADRLLSVSRSMEHLRRHGNLSRSSSNSTAPAASPIVSAMVESFEALQAATATSTLGYELLRTKSAGQRPAGLVSPPSTLSPSPSVPRSPSPSPAGKAQGPDAILTAQSLGAADQRGSIAAQDENTTVPPTAAATPNPDPSAPIPGDSDAHAAVPALPPSSSGPDSPPSTTVAAETTVIRPTPSAHQRQQRSRALSNPIRPILRTSSSASLSLSHPVPDLNKLSQAGSFLGNIAALEATAERLSMTSSIEDAIREEHNELKRSESRRSSILRARAASAASDTGSAWGQSQLSVASRQNSILGINSAARLGGYSPGGFVMSPQHPISAAPTRLRSASKASSIGMPSYISEPANTAASDDADYAQEFRFLPRHGPGKASTRSATSKLSLAQIAELEQPTALTQEAFDAADRAAEADETPDEDIRNSALQFIEAEFADEPDALQAGLDGFRDEAAPRLQLHQADGYQPYGAYMDGDDRPTTSASHTTFEQAQAAFGDFDGVHCDPDAGEFAPSPPEPEPQEPPPPQPRPRAAHAPRPTTYFDPTTGQQMMFYPAPVPAMLNLPPKLSKRPKAAPKNIPRSQLVSTLPTVPRDSRLWLPDPTEGLRAGAEDAPFMPEFLGDGNTSSDPAGAPSGTQGETPIRPPHARQASEASTIHPPPEQRAIRRPQRLTDADNRKSRPMALDALPPQLRASAFFDLPSELPKIEVKDGSAMNTLDSLLDASAAAPVNAFTDHAFAGKLGAEVYGPEKKKKKGKKAAAAAASATVAAVPEENAKRKTLVKRNSSGNLLEPGADDKPKRNVLVKRNSSGNLLEPPTEKKRTSRFSFFGTKHAEEESDDDDDDDDRPRSARRSADDDARSRGSASPNQLAPEADDEETDEESEEDEGQLYQGAPTTLLAELQLRKQQNKLRTRPLLQPNGMRSTLLELDAVAEVERKARHGKRVMLAWEDPAAVPRDEDEEDDDVPLGMLYAAKAAGAANRSTMDISALMSEVHRPLGLMERRELEENEPLSRRRARLQGKVNEHLPTSLTELQKRMSHMPGGGGGLGMGMRSQTRLALPLPSGDNGSRAGSMLGSRPGSRQGDLNPPGDDESEPEIPGETLAARKARLAAENPLPRARPVSGAFSSELLREFSPDGEAEEAAKSNNPGVETPEAPVPEEEESLGQRRRRLQAEREAREREMAFSSLTRAATPLGLNINSNPSPGTSTIRPVRPGPTPLASPAAAAGPMSMADVLGAHAKHGVVMDPREQERMRREAEAVRAQREMDMKMAALRAQMPTSLTVPSVGARQGGYMAGRFNDGLGGAQIGGHGALGYGNSGGLLGMQQQQQQQQRASTMLGVQGMMGMGQGAYGGSTPNLAVYPGGVQPSMSATALPMQMPMGGVPQGYGMGMPVQMQMPMQMQMQMQMGGQPGHMDMVERWRQGVMP
ncbi:hypothetical protein NEMBOFW57_004686 [Staphylotrichum longicolle]|uniref:Uncharacterized protein n=1 Tax=Staphylotrichum longicolle TaxID=669026 RepID=A0AAD4F848_9PEZI|nr:hypothetical protein NEMBOFW57_004686 [Staphylotrichum longicolle]